MASNSLDSAIDFNSAETNPQSDVTQSVTVVNGFFEAAAQDGKRPPTFQAHTQEGDDSLKQLWQDFGGEG